MTGGPPSSTGSIRRTRWRAARSTLTLAIGGAAVALVVLGVLAWLAWSREGSVAVAVIIGLLGLAGIGYLWRFALHPSIEFTEDEVVVRNPFRTTRLPLDDLSVVAPGADGLVLATDEDRIEAWCVQKSLGAIRAGRHDTRADRIAAELCAHLDSRDDVTGDDRTADGEQTADPDDRAAAGFRIRRATLAQAPVLADLERRASETALGHLFGDQPYPVEDVTDRWRRVLLDPRAQVRIAEQEGEPVGYLAYTDSQVLHLGVRPDHFRRGYGSRLLDHATAEIFARLVPQAHLWVLEENTGAREFYTARGWVATGERGTSEFPPYPAEVELALANPVTPRHGRR